MGSNKVTTNKRDREKVKQQKRQEKQKRKEERQKSGTNSFDDMIAYVDEFGVLHSTPPEPSEEIIDAADIEISVPRQEAEEIVPTSGIVEHFNSEKGFGFIRDSKTRESYFFHISSAPRNIAEGDVVSFDTEESARGMNAVNITINENQK